jgi:cardiolipin synthase
VISWIPNGLSLLRIGLSPVLVFCMQQKNMYVYGAVITVLALVTDVADGWLARTYQCESRVGRVLDPLADKIFSLVLFVCLVSQGFISPWVLGVIVARDVGLAVGSFVLWCHNKVILPAHWTSKVNTVLQALIGVGCLLSWPFAWMVPIMVGTTFVSSFIYAVQGWKSW